MTAKTTNERQREMRERREASGLKEVRNLWCHPDDEAAVKNYAAKLAKKRTKPPPSQPSGR